MTPFSIPEVFRQVDERKARLDAHRPLPPATAASLRAKLTLDWTYHSNAIEGNTLTLIETKVVMEDGITIGGKSLREHLEVIGHREAINFVYDLIANNREMDTRVIRDIHQLVLRSIDDANAGRYRTVNVRITGASHAPPNYMRLEEKMDGLMHWYQHEAARLHPIERAAQLHTRFVEIHPFIDGNGRTARLLLNLELMKEGYPVAIIRKEDRMTYYGLLDDACVRHDYSGITNMVAQAIDRSLDVYLEVVAGKEPEPPEPNPGKQPFKPVMKNRDRGLSR